MNYTLPLILSLVYYGAFIIFQALGIYSLNLNYKNKENQLLFALHLSFEFWAFGLSAMCYAVTESDAIMWARIAGIGWLSFIPIGAHFILVYLNEDFLKGKRWLLYVIPIISYLGIFVYDSGSPEIMMIMTKYGYSTSRFITTENFKFFDYLYRIQWFFYNVLIFYFIVKYYKKNKNKTQFKKVRLVLIAFELSFMVGIFTNYLNLLIDIDFPKLTILLMVIVSIILTINASKNKFFSKSISFPIKRFAEKTKSHFMPLNYIRNEYVKSMVMRVLKKIGYEMEDFRYSISAINIRMSHAVIVMFNIFFMVSFYYYRISVNFVYVALLILIGFLLYFVNLIDFSEIKKDIFTNMLMVVSIFVMAQFFLYINISSIWIFGLIVLILNSTSLRKFNIAVIIFAIASTEYIMFFKKAGMVYYLNSMSYIFRVLLVCVIAYIVYFIHHKIRLNYNKSQENLKFQEMMTKIAMVGSTNDYSITQSIRQVLSLSANYLGAEKSYIVELEQNKEDSRWIYSEDGSSYYNLEELFISPIIKNNECIYVSNILTLSYDNQMQVKNLFGEDIKSVIIIPIFSKEQMISLFFYENRENNLKQVGNDVIYTIANTVTNMYDKIKTEETIYKYAYYDTQTMMPNRNLFVKKLTETLNDKKNFNVAVIFVDCKSYKKFEGIGEYKMNAAMFKNIANRIEQCDIEDLFVARFGGDKFIVFIRNFEDAEYESRKIMRAFEKPFYINGNQFKLIISIGISTYPKDGDDPETLIKNADLALYEIKKNSSGQVLSFSSSISEKFDEKAMISSHLYRAIEKNELELFYQPQVDAKTRKIIGAEALIRWFHPTKGMISPGVFIPIAEETGVINEIGQWVIEEAAEQLYEWQKKYNADFLLAVNVSTKQLQDSELADKIKTHVQRIGVKADNFEIEITESDEISTESYAVETLVKLRESGHPIAIDDFGTRFSSPQRFRFIPATKLKIDMKFVRDMERGERYKRIVLSIINLAKNLGLKVIAEGVETTEQYNYLRDNGCDEIQGYYFYKPMKASELDELLREQGGAVL